jgi:FAD-linked sulfhydryl oxidase
MNPKFWGPHAWIFLHSVTMNYPKNPTDQDKQRYREFFKSMERVLPCEKCAFHYSSHIDEFPIDPALESRDSLINWLIQIHNEVNISLHKPEYTYDQVIEEYRYKMNNLDKDETLVYKVIILGLLAYIIFKICKK